MSEIDVSKCEYYDDGNCDKYYDVECSDHPECIYKQLQQLKAERDLLIQQLVVLDGEDVTVQVTQEQFEEYNKLKAENEELKKKLQNASDVLILEMGQKEQYQDEYVIEKIDKKKYKQCLDEIETLITENDNYFTDDILQKIKEVKGNE